MCLKIFICKCRTPTILIWLTANEALPGISAKLLYLNKLYLVTPKYLEPYLQFVKNNKRLFRTTLKYYELFKWNNTYAYMYEHIFNPILDRYDASENVKAYLVSFYMKGLIAIIDRWVLNDCAESIPELMDIIKTCMNR